VEGRFRPQLINQASLKKVSLKAKTLEFRVQNLRKGCSNNIQTNFNSKKIIRREREVEAF
jgi:hypothetical protein